MDKKFESDGCSVVPDYDQQECCVRHDWLYYQGGGFRDRLEADRQFYNCVKKTSTGWLAGIRWFGVRIGGVGFLPFAKWRWGYGWKFPRTKAPADDRSEFPLEGEQARFEEALEKAREHDRKAREK